MVKRESKLYKENDKKIKIIKEKYYQTDPQITHG